MFFWILQNLTSISVAFKCTNFKCANNILTSLLIKNNDHYLYILYNDKIRILRERFTKTHSTLWTMSSCVPSGSGLPLSCIRGTKEKPKSFFSPFSFAAWTERTVVMWNESIMGTSKISEGGITSGRKINVQEKSACEA